eukprot:6529424-Pyramimonas_sp.AAC.1
MAASFALYFCHLSNLALSLTTLPSRRSSRAVFGVARGGMATVWCSCWWRARPSWVPSKPQALNWNPNGDGKG